MSGDFRVTLSFISQGFAIFPRINIVAICTWIPSIKLERESALEFSTPSGLHYAQSGSPHFELSP
jgi:hypothetical protein